MDIKVMELKMKVLNGVSKIHQSDIMNDGYKKLLMCQSTNSRWMKCMVLRKEIETMRKRLISIKNEINDFIVNHLNGFDTKYNLTTYILILDVELTTLDEKINKLNKILNDKNICFKP